MIISLKKCIRICFFLLPVMVMYGSYAVFFKIPGVGYLNLQRLYFYTLLFLGAVYCAVAGRVSIHFGQAGRYALFFIILLLYATVSLFWVKDMWYSYHVSYMYLLTGVFLVLFVTAECRSFEDLTVFLRVCTVCYLVTVLLGISEIHSGSYLFTQNTRILLYKNPYGLYFPHASFYNTNDYSTYVVLFAPFAAFQIASDLKGPMGKTAAALAVLSGLYTVLNANARICYYAAALFAVAFLAAFFSRHEMKKYVRPVLTAAAFFLVIFLVLVLTSVIKVNIFRGELSVSTGDHSLQERSELYSAAFAMLASYFWVGVGVGNSVPLVPSFSSLSAINLHSMPLQILAEYGVVIFILYLLMMLSIGIHLFRFKGGQAKHRIWACVCFGSLLCFQVAGFSSSDATHIGEVWLTMAIWLATIKVLHQEGKPVGTPSEVR